MVRKTLASLSVLDISFVRSPHPLKQESRDPSSFQFEFVYNGGGAHFLQPLFGQAVELFLFFQNVVPRNHQIWFDHKHLYPRSHLVQPKVGILDSWPTPTLWKMVCLQKLLLVSTAVALWSTWLPLFWTVKFFSCHTLFTIPMKQFPLLLKAYPLLRSILSCQLKMIPLLFFCVFKFSAKVEVYKKDGRKYNSFPCVKNLSLSDVNRQKQHLFKDILS